MVDIAEGAVQLSRPENSALINMDDVAMLRSISSRIRIGVSSIRPLSVLLLAAGLLSACTPTLIVHGQKPHPDDLQLIEVGRSTRTDVQSRLGTPSTSSVFSDNVWYYYSETTEQVAFFEPEVKERRIIAIVYGPDDKVADVATYTEADGKPIELVSRVTPTAGNELTILQQLFGNLGRFPTPQSQ